MRKRLFALIVAASLFTATPSVAAESALYQLTFTNLQQQQVSLATFKNQVLLVNFWATWCPPCVKEMPEMERLRQHFSGQPFEIIAINTGQPAEAVQNFLNTMDPPLTFPILLDQKGRSFKEFGLKGLPMSFIFDYNGQRVETITGARKWDSAQSIKLIEQVLSGH